MNTYFSPKLKFKRMFVNILSILVILALAVPVTRNASAQEAALPEGWHDGTEGTVDAVGCSAFGWAVDPDDRDRDLQVQILADGSPVATTTANLLREDVETCTEGTCGFVIDLWGLISAGVEHSITARAYDEETQSWVDLSGTPKTVTCWGYPEGFHDGVEGVVDANNCSAFGWAADPDDRDRDVQVRILSDGVEVASRPASDYGEDMELNEICPGGTCRFTVNLADIISLDEAHEITVQAYDEETAAWMDLEATPKVLTCQTPPPPNPYIAVSLTQHWFIVEHFQPDTLVTISVYESQDPASAVMAFSRYSDASGRMSIEGWEHGWDLEPGNYVVATDGVTTKELILEYITLDVFDPEHDLVSGMALPGREVGVGVGNAHGEQWLTVIADETSGLWTADFTTVEFDISPDAWAGGHVSDEDGDVTAAHNFGPALGPRFTVFPEWEWFDGLDWPDGATVNITVDGKPECETAKESWGSFFNGSFGAGCDLEIGDTVTFTDGTTTRTHIVRNLDVTGVDAKKDTITGVADPGTLVYVWPHDPSFEPLQTTATGSGVWKVDLSVVGYDLQTGVAGRSEIRDALGNATAVDWYVPNPRFSAFPEWEAIEGWEWTPGANIRLTIDDPATKTKRDFQQEQTVVVTPWDPNNWWVSFNFAGEYDLKAGDVVTLADGKTTRTHIVQNLTITAVDQEEDIVSGGADANAEVHVWPHETGQEILATASNEGSWQADFTGMFDLEPGTGGRAEVRDEAGNATAVDWRVPYPHFSIFPEWEYVEGYEWPEDATVTASLEGSPDCVAEGVSGYPEWDQWNTFVSMNFPEGCDIQAGHVVTLTDGTTTLTHTVKNLSITGVDPDEDLVSGMANPDAWIQVWPHATGQQLQVQADSTGAWQVDFTDTFDLVPGEGGRSEIRDEAGNATAVDWYVPSPRIVASITEDWFYLNEFAPDSLINFSIYESQGGPLLWEGSTTTDSSGWAWVDAEGRWDLEPGMYLVVSDGAVTKDLVVEGFTFDVFDVTRGLLKGTAPEPSGRRVWVGIGFGAGGWFLDVTTNKKGVWMADFGAPVPNGYDWVAAQIFDADGDASELRPARIIDRTVTAGNFYVEWSTTNPEEIVDLRWNGWVNLTNTWAHPACPDDLEFFGNSWASENEGDDLFYFGSLVGWGTSGTWKEQSGSKIRINSKSSGCPGSENIPIKTDYRFFDDPLRANLMVVQRTIKFGDEPYAHDVRPFIPRLYPSDGFSQVLHPNAAGDELVTDGTCDLGCVAESWDGSWFAIHNPTSGVGIIVQRKPSASSAALWLDDDDGSFTNSSSILLLQPAGGFVGTVTETEYLCFYDSTTWTPSLTLPEGCRP